AAAAAGALPGAAGETPALEGSEAMVSLGMVEGQMRASSITRMQDLVERHPDESLTVVRRWMTPEGA
ncbi:flagellar M-ring protein FliF, partial [Roseomonas oryzicola]|nr:flagellar M-ring protein FliF [Neoroseomonas oryzicola]